ncbi:pilus assembly protein PilY [Aquirhabdus sp.]|uniref:pilus assembly protein PilY n=1 Tax=Aquirhabdus sp. TaxID=2824160 RepID=UPI00396CF1CF
MYSQIKARESSTQNIFFGAMLITFMCGTAHATDSAIYRPGTSGQITLVMMLDNSGSMGTSSYNEDFGLGSCSESTENSPNTSLPTYSRGYCPVSQSKLNGLTSYYQNNVRTGCTATGAAASPTTNIVYKCYTRINRLKSGMYAALDDQTSFAIPDTVVMGVGTFADSNSGKILQPALPLGPVVSNGTGTTGQRYILKQQISGLSALYNTPTAPAYAEAGAYLLGTSTANNISVATDVYRKNSSGKYSNCSSLNGASLTSSPATNTCSSWSSTTSSTQPSSAYDTTVTRNISGTTYTVYIKNVLTADPDSGFSSSVASSKNSAGTAYVSPLPAVANRASCDGQGIYFLTDGEPNGPAYDQSLVMKAALGTSASTFSCSAVQTTYKALGQSAVTGAGILTGGINTYPAWNCIGTFAQALYGNASEYVNTKTGATNTKGDGATNPLYNSSATIKGAPIQTAMVGFGSVFDTITNPDPANACKWGSRRGGAGSELCTGGGYGAGGFYRALSDASVTNSVYQFIQDLANNDISPLVTGAASIPIDSLNPTGFEKFGYMRMLTPNPKDTTQLVWSGNLKKYNISGGALTDASNRQVLNTDGTFVFGTPDPVTNLPTASTTDLWNSSGSPDGGFTNKGGANSKVPMPTSANGIANTVPRTIRPIFTNFSSTASDTELLATASSTANCGSTCGVDLLPAPASTTAASLTDAYVTTKFNATPLTNIPMAKRLALLNYLGYNVPISPLPTTVPTLAAPSSPFLTAGAIMHSMPVQLSYSGTLNADGTLGTTRVESVLYGTMEGALHLVAAGSGTGATSAGGVEQMVFVPKEILDKTVASQALIQNAAGTQITQTAVLPQTTTLSQVPAQGVDGAWVSDASYTVSRPNLPGGTSTITATTMNVYGGLRLGGNSYYGLNLKTPTAPKLLFRISAPLTTSGTDPMVGKGFDRMGYTWSKPILTNVRWNGVITRVMIVGGGYDLCYENPLFTLNSTTQTDTLCNSKSSAAGNAVYMVNATTGQLLWMASNVAAPTGFNSTLNSYMTHSIVGRISTLDRDADGLTDHLYFADLGGQVFRADFNNASQRTLNNTGAFAVRVVRLANLASSTAANSPRFYEAPTATIHDEGADTFIVVGVASGDRSSPLDVLATSVGGKGVTKPVNNVYAIMDRDFIKADLITNKCYNGGGMGTGSCSSTTPLLTADTTVSQLQQNPQLLSGNVPSTFFPKTASTKNGWYRSLSSNSAGAELASKTAGGMKAFEEPLAITGNLLVPVYDPEGTATPQPDPCSAKVVGETIRERFCLPYGACLNTSGSASGSVDSSRESTTGAVVNTLSSHPTLIGSGIRGIALGPDDNGGMTLLGNTSGTGGWSSNRQLIPTRWYEKLPNPSKVK